MATEKQAPEEQHKNARIQVTKNGPYIVSGTIPLVKLIVRTDADGYPLTYVQSEKFAVDETYSLCRCGQSKGKPWCDGTHVEVRFDGTESVSRAPYCTRAKEIDGPDLKVTDVPDLCNHAGFCLRANGIGKLTRSSDDPEAKRIAIEEAWNCTSGRLVALEKESERPVEPEFEPSIAVIEEPHKACSGPLWVRGNIPIVSSDGETYEVRNRVALCRCGASCNKPLCDGSHVVTKFTDGDVSLDRWEPQEG
ncbi:MAG: CDGSH iron-sulfur domain-containing protein [Halobacteriota archaeon]